MKPFDPISILFLSFIVIGTHCHFLKETKSSSEEISKTEADLSLVHFLFWSRSHFDDLGYFEIVSEDEVNLELSGFDGSLNTYFLFHGYTDSGTKQWILDAKTELLLQEECNVISVEFGALVPSPNYPAAVANMYNVSAHTAGLIDWLVLTAGASTDRIQLVGHSLGAHAAGMTAEYVLAGQIDRITGLDPAGPLFYNETNNRRLYKSQAHFVDIIHTNGCSILRGCSGIAESLGHADFFPNGGSSQAGCTALTESSSSCSHQRVTTLWTESITAGEGPTNEIETFISFPCSSWDSFEAGECASCGFTCLNMGFHIQREYVDAVNGDYFLYTNEEAPYALGDTQTPPS